MKNDLNYAAELIRQADGILITAGAGMSVDSGLADFCSVGGLIRINPIDAGVPKMHFLSLEIDLTSG